MADLKTALKSTLLPMRKAGGRFFGVGTSQENTIIYKAAQLLSAELVEGDYLEFGVYRGGSFAHAFHTMRDVYRTRSVDHIHSPEYHQRVLEIWNRMRFFAFDSFAGLPDPVGTDRESKDFTAARFAYDVSDFCKNLKASGVDLSKVVVVPGWFDDTCNDQTIQKHQIKAASVVHVDCDLYESTKVALKFVEPLLVDGTVVIFDDWYCFRGNPNLGEQRAFNEWAKGLTNWQFTEYQKEGPWRASFIASSVEMRSPE